MCRVNNQLEDVSAGTTADNRVFGADDQYHVDGPEPTSGEDKEKIRAEARRMAKQTGISARELSRLLGKMKDAANVIPVAPLFYRNLQMSLSGALNVKYQSYEAQVDLSLESREELEWWDTTT